MQGMGHIVTLVSGIAATIASILIGHPYFALVFAVPTVLLFVALVIRADPEI